MLQINVDVSDLMSVKGDMQSAVIAIQQGMTDAGTFIRDTWVQAVSGNKLEGMTKVVNDDAYAKSIKVLRESMSGDSLSIIVGPFNYERAQDIEQGLPAYDMKPFLLNGPKSRPTKDGKGRYNIVPFRHDVPRSGDGGFSAIGLRMQMPKDIYKQAKQLVKSVPNATTGKIDWGQSLHIEEMGSINKMSLYQHKANQYEGMYRVGYEKHSQYLTFRTVSTPRTDKNGKRKGSAPNSWIHPATPANPIVRAVYNYCMPRIETNLDELLRELFT